MGSFLGRVQLEIISDLLVEKYQLNTTAKEPTVIYMERPLKAVSHTIHIEVPPNPFWASIGLSVTPLPLGTGVQYESKVSVGYLNQSFQNAVLDGIRYGLEQSTQICRVQLSVRRQGAQLVLLVQNDGSLYEDDLLEKLRLMKHKEERLEKLDASMDTYRGTAVYLKEHMGVIVVVFGITFVQRMALFAATWFVYRAFGLSGTSFFDILFLQAVIAVAVDMLPLPGGMGISETLFLNIFRPVFGSLLLPGMVLSRGLGYYAELLISAAFTVVAQLTIGNEKVREQKKCIKERVEG